MNPDYRPMPDEIRENLIRFARETWRNDGAEGETVHRLCDELECAVRERNAAEGRLGEATKRARRSESDAAESRAWHQTAIELKKRLVAAEDELTRMKGPALAYASNGEAGDGQHVCSSCGEERDQPHTWEECAKRLAEMHEKADGAYWDAVHERDEAEQRFLDFITIVDYVPPSLSPGWGEFLRKIQARHGGQGNDVPGSEKERIDTWRELWVIATSNAAALRSELRERAEAHQEENARADAAEADADRAVLALAGMVEAHGVEHADDCSCGDDCCCGVRQRWLWLTTDRVVLAKNRTDARQNRGGTGG